MHKKNNIPFVEISFFRHFIKMVTKKNLLKNKSNLGQDLKKST